MKKITEDGFIECLAPPYRLMAEANRMSKESFDYLCASVRNSILEEAAKVCDGVGNLADQQRRGLGVMTDYEIACAQQGRAPTAQGQIGAAIRALKSDAAPEQ